MYKYLTIFLLTTCFLLLTSNACAQQVSVGIFPPAVEVVASGGHDFDLTFVLQNKSDPAIYQIRLEPFGGSNGGPFEYLLDDKKIADYQAFFLAPGQKKQINLHVRVPQDTPEGDYYLKFVAQSQPAVQADQSQALISTGVASKILISVTHDGTLEVSPKMTRFSLLGGQKLSFFGHDFYLVDAGTSLPLAMSIANEGRNFFHAQGTLSVNRLLGQVDPFEIPQQVILAHSAATVATKGGDSVGTSTTVLPTSWPGFYAASAAVNFGPGTPTLFASATYVVFPIKLLGVIFIVLILFLSYKKYRPRG